MPLNTYVHFRTPGTYTCSASAADVTMISRDEKVRQALLVKSNPVVLTIAEDHAWSRSAEIAYADAYNKLCRGNDVATQRFLQCSELARRITYLDTADSLATEVKIFDGRNHGWENGFWDAIQHSSYPNDALHLMANRIARSRTSRCRRWFLNRWLHGTSESTRRTRFNHPHLRLIIPQPSRSFGNMSGYSAAACARKNPDVRSESAKTYRWFAEQEYCEGQPLISREERKQALLPQSIHP